MLSNKLCNNDNQCVDNYMCSFDEKNLTFRRNQDLLRLSKCLYFLMSLVIFSCCVLSLFILFSIFLISFNIIDGGGGGI